MLCDKLPRAQLTYLPTPLEDAPRLGKALGGPRILIKRDDRSGLSFGGNKPRIFEYVIGDALAQECDVLVTAAGRQSNHLREVTVAANKLGLKSVLVVMGSPAEEAPQGNLLLFHLLEADIRYFTRSEHMEAYFGPELMKFCEDVAAEYAAQGRKPYIVHLSLRAGLLGSVAHVQAAEELAAQLAARGSAPERLYVACGSGVTTSGYVLGLKHLGLPTRVVAGSLVFPVERVTADIAHYANLAAEELGLDTRITPDDFDVLDCSAGGYGVVTPPVREAIRVVARSEGLILDPTYNGKVMSALIGQIRAGELSPGGEIVFVNTGGVPALFAANQDLLA